MDRHPLTSHAHPRISRLRNHWKFGGVPGGESAGHFDEVGYAVLMKNAGGDRRTVAACTVDGDAAAAGNFCEALLQVVEGNVQALRDVFGFPLAGIADVQDHGRFGAGQFFRYHRRGDPFRWPDQVWPFGERYHAAVQITAHLIEADAAQA